jgi:hypothetical protein
MHVLIGDPQPNPCYLRSCFQGQLEVDKHIIKINSSCNRYLSPWKEIV